MRDGEALLYDYLEAGTPISAADVLLRAMFDVGYFPPNTPLNEPARRHEPI
jgi:hypothetical protein